MKNVRTFEFAFILSVILGTIAVAQAIDAPDSTWKVGKVQGGQFVLPDSIGGVKLEGYITMVLWVNKSGRLLHYYVAAIEAFEKASRKSKYRFSLGAANPISARKARSVRGAEVLNLFAPTIDQYTKSIRFTPNPRFNHWIGDSANVGYTIEFGRSTK